VAVLVALIEHINLKLSLPLAPVELLISCRFSAGSR